MLNEELEPNVIIIGGGIAGVAAAHRLLHQKSFNGSVTILEAQDWLGGRIHSAIIAGKKVELGANWIHGIIDNPIYNLACRMNLIDPLEINKTSPHEFLHVMGRTISGEMVPFSKIIQIYGIYFSFIKTCENYFHSLKKISKTSEKDIPYFSVGEALRAMISNYLKTRPEKERALEQSIFENFINRENVITACDSLTQVSLKDFGAYQELPGGNVTIPKGYSQILDFLIEEIKIKLKTMSRLNQFKIFTNHEVVKINWHGIGNNQSSKINVRCSNNLEFFCDHLIITFPLGVLKKYHEQLFEPFLPQYKIDCIKRIGFGVVDKIFLIYDEPLSPKFIDEGINEILPFWNIRDDNDYQWPHKIYSFSKVTEVCLLVWATGKDALMVEACDSSTIGEELTNQLRNILKRPNFPQPVSVFKTNWGSNPFFHGSYTYISTNSFVSDIDHLAEPIYSKPENEKPVLLFAGEACHKSFFSTAHGALLSGYKAADYLLNNDSLTQPN